MVDIHFQPPQNFAAYRQSELDNARVPTFTQMSAIPYISNRFALQRFLGLSAEEIAENERLWKEENDENIQVNTADASAEMRSAGISSAGISADIGGAEDIDASEDPLAGDDATPPDTATEETPGAGGAGEEPGSAPAT